MSDLEKFKQLFDEIGIEYSEKQNNNGETSLEVSEKSLFVYGSAELSVEFSKDGEFVYFSPSGE